MLIWDKIEQQISVSIAQSFHFKKVAEITGGDINQAYRVSGVVMEEGISKDVSFFAKFNQRSLLDMFEAEAAGLQEILKTQTICVPYVICSGVEGNQSYLILDHLTLSHGNSESAKYLGQNIALMHKSTSPQFGWFRDNTIGATKQVNAPSENWVDFWRDYRLGFQLELAKQNGIEQSLYSKGQKLLTQIEQFFIDYEPQVSLLHGDLWSGNYGYLNNGEPVIFDPAVYYGDREADIAMTELFGGFPVEFYSAYNEVWQLDEGLKTAMTPKFNKPQASQPAAFIKGILLY